MTSKDALLLIKFFTHRKNLTPAQQSKLDLLLARDYMTIGSRVTPDTDVMRLLDIWEQQGLDAAVAAWKATPEQYFKDHLTEESRDGKKPRMKHGKRRTSDSLIPNDNAGTKGKLEKSKEKKERGKSKGTTLSKEDLKDMELSIDEFIVTKEDLEFIRQLSIKGGEEDHNEGSPSPDSPVFKIKWSRQS